MTPVQPVRAHRRFANAPENVGAALLAILSVVLGLRSVMLWAPSVAAPIPLLSGIRVDVLPPRLGLPVTDGWTLRWWLVETISALVFIGGYWFWARYAKHPAPTRDDAFRRGWASVIAALVAAQAVRATLTGLVTDDGLISFLLMLAGSVVIAAVVGLILGIPVGLVCAAVPPAKEPDGRESYSDRSPGGDTRDAETDQPGESSADPADSRDPEPPDSAGTAASP